MRPVKNHSIPLATRAHVRGAGTTARRAWRTAYVRRLVATDAACALAAAAVTAWVGPRPPGASSAVLAVLVLVVPLVWIAALSLARGYEQRFLWHGPEEFRRVLRAAVALVVTAGAASWVLRIEVPRGFVAVTLLLAAVATVGQRCGQRAWLHRQRRLGRSFETTLLVGHRSGVAALHEQLRRQVSEGRRVVGCCLPPTGERSFDGLPVLGDLDEVKRAVDFYQVDTVVVLPSPELDGSALRRLGRELEDTPAELLVAPAVTELAGLRVRARPSFGLPLLRLEQPELRGAGLLVKESFDRCAALILLVLLLPVLVAIAVATKVSGPGPVFHRERRVGRGGRVFGMVTFRTTAVPPRPGRLPDAPGAADRGGPRQLHADPQVTPVGRFLRAHSLHELPRLLSVLIGRMSLVGPRPPLPCEVAHLGADLGHRFVLKPGLTGLWQFTGRSDLSWDDAVRMDVRYVENWSLTLDLMILARTLRAGVRGETAR